MFVRALAALTLTACTSALLPTVPEPLRLSHLEDVRAEDLAFVPAQTTLVEAEAALSKRVTGVTKSTGSVVLGSSSQPEELAVIGGDFQRSLHLFRNGRYWQSEALPADAPAYGLALGVAQRGGDALLLVVQQSPLDGASGNRLLMYAASERGIELRASRTLDDLAADNGGMSHPRLIGRDIEDGVLLIARDDDGILWDDTYVFSAGDVSSGGGLRVVARPLSESIRCSCVRGYVAGKLTD